MPVKDAAEKLLYDVELFNYFDSLKNINEKQYISEHKDYLIVVSSGYGKQNIKPGDYIEEFRKFINENKGKVSALKILCQTPDRLSRAELKEIKIILDENGYTETTLNAAIKDLKNSDLMADIITFVRNAALDEPLVSHEARIKSAVDKIRNLKKWSSLQLKWLDRKH